MGSRRLLVAQVLASFALPAGATGAGILAAGLGGSAWSAAPLAALVAGSGAASVGVSRLTARRNRRTALRTAYAVAAFGSVLIVVAAALAQMMVLLLGCALFGAANAAAMLSRYASADLVEAHERGRALSTMMLALTVGAVVAPNLLGPSSVLARVAGAPPASGIFVVAAAALLAASAWLPDLPRINPDLPLVEVPSARGAGGVGPRILVRGAAGPLVVLASANLVMVTVMAVVPPTLHAHGTSLDRVGWVVSAHVLAMFAPAVLVGRAVDRVGARRVATVGTWVTAAVAALGVAAAGDTTAQPLLLVLLGAAWCVQVVAGSAWLLQDSAPAGRPLAEGLGEVWMAAAALVGTLLAAPLLAAGGGLALHVALAALATSAACVASSPRTWRP